MIIADEGYYFGIGAFETIAVENGTPLFLPQHYERLLNTLELLEISQTLSDIKKKVFSTLTDDTIRYGRKILKIAVSEKNIITYIRTNHYQRKDYENGFITSISNIRRNETSPLTYHKTLNYGDCIMEKRQAQRAGIHEPVFLNTRGELAEGATTNIFFIKDKKIITPPLSCGMLPGIIREYLLHTYEIREQIVLPEDIIKYDEMFLTNSLLGIMPVRKIENHMFHSMAFAAQLSRNFLSKFTFGTS